MKVVAFNGSPRVNGNTHQALEFVLEELRKEGIETELIDICREDLRPCRACGSCGKNKDERCVMADDRLNASSMIRSSIRFAFAGGPVGCTMKTSAPRTFSSIWQ